MQRWVIRAIVSAVVAAVLLTVVPLESVILAIKRISLGTWVASLGVFFVGHYFNAVKLRILVGPAFVSLAPCVRAQYAGLVANLSLPGLAGGDLVRAAYLVPLAGAKRIGLASLADRILDTLTLLALVAAALPLAGIPASIAERLPGAAAWLTLASIGTLAIVALCLYRKHPKIARVVQPVLSEFRARRGDLWSAVAISFSVQSAFVLTNAWLARDVGVTTSLAAWFVAWPLSKLIAVLPVSLGGIGVREAALVTLLTPYGAPTDAVLASGFLWQSVLIVSGLAGLVVTQWLWQPDRAPTAPLPKGND